MGQITASRLSQHGNIRIKNRPLRADICHMMISDEQVRRAVEYLRTTDTYSVALPEASDPAATELVGRVVASLKELPDIRPDRIAHARMLIEEDLPTSDELASKLIGRMLSDALR